MLRSLWEKAEPWLTRAGHFDLLFVKTGIGGLIVTGISGLVIGALAWAHQAPLYQVVLAAMLAMGSALFIANQSLRLITAWRAPTAITRQQARRLDREDPHGVRIGGGTAVVITLLASSLIIVGGLDASNRYAQWQKDVEGTFLELLFTDFDVNFTMPKYPLTVNITAVNHGYLPVVGPVSDYSFEYPKQDLTPEQLDHSFRVLDAKIGNPVDNGEYMSANSDTWSTAMDERFTTEQWNNFLSDQLKIYLLVRFKYLVSGYVKITDSCVLYRQFDQPKPHPHLCGRHNKWQWQ